MLCMIGAPLFVCFRAASYLRMVWCRCHRLVASFNHTQTVGDIRAFINSSNPGMAAVTYPLATTIPRKVLADNTATVKLPDTPPSLPDLPLAGRGCCCWCFVLPSGCITFALRFVAFKVLAVRVSRTDHVCVWCWCDGVLRSRLKVF